MSEKSITVRTDDVWSFNGIAVPHGRPMMITEEYAALSHFVMLAEGDHVEIGCGWGGSAIVAALTKKAKGDGKVYTVDPLSQDRYDFGLKTDLVYENFETFGVDDLIVHVDKPSYPWPIEGKRFASGLIDGDHSFDGCLQDWEILKEVVDEYILVHDVWEVAWPAVTEAWQIMCQDPDWVVRYLDAQMGVLMKVIYK